MLSAIQKAEKNAHITRVDEYTVDYFRRELGIKLATLFSPEHGFHLNEQAGEAGFYSRFPEGKGIVVAPGTGMVAYGMYNGRKERSSLWTTAMVLVAPPSTDRIST